MTDDAVVVEPWGGPDSRRGQVFAAVFPHSDDFSIFAGGLVQKLIREGATGYFIRLTNDEMDSYDLSAGETMFRIEQETRAVAAAFGVQKVYDLNYKNHYLDHAMLTEIRHRLIALFRFLKVDTVIAFDPWGHYEENPDHTISGMAVEQACWMAGRPLDLPELADMGLRPHFVTEKYYVARGPQLVNRVIDVTPVADEKLAAMLLHATPMDNMFRQELDADPACPWRTVEEFVRGTLLDNQPEYRGFRYYEKYHHIGR
ncbi:MAG: PIG-L family deacetylase [Planctomycetes bacterium]|nr:PIG-L family deacetylase [Planctomycetota bacterium]